jgi:hypothetical protein
VPPVEPVSCFLSLPLDAEQLCVAATASAIARIEYNSPQICPRRMMLESQGAPSLATFNDESRGGGARFGCS